MGKSTIGMLMALNEKPDKGEILWEGNPIHFNILGPQNNPGVQILFQSEGLIDYFSVAENMFLPERLFLPFPFKGRKKWSFWLKRLSKSLVSTWTLMLTISV
jgi:ABC-type sugar transport system ATPase subunit